MNRARHNVELAEPLRAVLPGGSGPVGAGLDTLLREREQAGYQRGWIQGQKALNEQLLQQRHDLLEIQNGLLSSLRNTLPQARRDCEKALAQLALEAARKLVAALPISAAMVEAAVQEALAHVDENTDYHVYLQPEDLELLQQINSPLLLTSVAGQKVHFHPAPELSRGGCVVKTRFGLIDARRETKYQQLQKAILS